MNAAEITPEMKKELAARGYRSPVEFCRIFLSEWFPQPMPWVHRGIFALLKGRTDFLLDFGKEEWRDAEGEWTPADLQKILTNFLDEKTGKPIFRLEFNEDGHPRVDIEVNEFVGIIMPRGYSKTTLINANSVHETVYKDEDFFLYVSETGPHAQRQLATVKGELEDNDGVPLNEMIHLVFGEFKPSRNSPLTWGAEFIETTKGTMFGALGTGGQVRGFGKRGKRPGKIVFDDLQDQDSVDSETQRKKDSRWFFTAALPARKKNGKAIIIGTLLHTEAILNKCVNHPKFTIVRFGAIDRQGEALWGWMQSLAQIEADKQAAASVGELANWYREYMSDFFEDESKMFPESKIVYVNRNAASFIALSMAMDPAISSERKSAMCAYAVSGIETGGHKHILDFSGKVGMDPAEQVEEFFRLHFKWFRGRPADLQRHGIEAMAYQRALIPMVRAKQVEFSKTYGNDAYFEVLPIFHGKTAKMTRVQGIIKPLMWAGHLTFNERWPALHTQFTDWPTGLLDGPDVCAMAIALLDPYVTLGLGDEGETQLEEDTAPRLELVVGGSFRSAP